MTEITIHLRAPACARPDIWDAVRAAISARTGSPVARLIRRAAPAVETSVLWLDEEALVALRAAAPPEMTIEEVAA